MQEVLPADGPELSGAEESGYRDLAQRLRCLAGDLGVSVPQVQAEALDLRGLPLDAIGAALRQGPGLTLTDAAWASADFVYRFTLPGSVAALQRMLALAGVEGPIDVLGPGQVLLARSRESAGLVVYDELWQPRLELEPRLEQARLGRRQVLFVDAAHFVLAPFLGCLWCLARLFVRSATGRQRYNVLGALNAVTHDVIRVCNEGYVTADTVCALLRSLAGVGSRAPITVVLDNARYQRCYLVQSLA